MHNFSEIYLASKSPRRQELLQQMGVKYQLLLFDIPEIVQAHEKPLDYSQRITKEKLEAAWQKIVTENLTPKPVLCADTEVVLAGKILGKPENYNAAFEMIKSYSGKRQEVITTIGLRFNAFEKMATNSTIVSFAEIPDDDIHKYLATGDYCDKSGSYGIQSYLGQFISSINGCFYSVMGLPLNTLREVLNELNNL